MLGIFAKELVLLCIGVLSSKQQIIQILDVYYTYGNLFYSDNETADFSKTVVTTYTTSWFRSPDNHNLNLLTSFFMAVSWMLLLMPRAENT
jgi:hypothetical protein